MQSVLSLLTGAVLVGLVYGLSFLPTATLERSDDVELADAESHPADADGGETPSRPDGAD